MELSRKTGLITAIAFVPALLLLAGAYQLWGRMAVRTRPWHLESFLESRIAEGRTGPGAPYFRTDYNRLLADAQAARNCLSQADRQFWLWRDYSSCIRRLLAVSLDASLLRLKRAQRAQEQRSRLDVLLSSLEREIGAHQGNGKIWSRFDLRDIEQKRAISLAAQARFLSDRGEVESALISAQRAWISWRRFNHAGDSEFARFQDLSLRSEWNRQAQALLDWTKKSGRRAILVDKLAHRCFLINRGRIEKSYAGDLGRNWYWRKARESDASTPEGEYKIRRMSPSGKYGYALLLDYPNSADWERFRALRREGVIPGNSRIGGNIEIHGGGRSSDWTDGCISLDDGDMRNLYRYAYPGMPVTIVGTSRVGAAQGNALQDSRSVQDEIRSN